LQQVSFPALTSVAGTHCFQTAFYGCTALVTAAFPMLESVSNGTGTNQGALENTFEGCTSLQSVDFSSLETISGRGTLWRCFLRCSSLTSVDFSSLKTINNGYAPLGQMFSGCTNLTSVSFPSLISVKNDSFAEFAYGSSLTEIHCRTDMQATIQALSGYSSCFGKGAGTITIYFDL
jgi:surface protein